MYKSTILTLIGISIVLASCNRGTKETTVIIAPPKEPVKKEAPAPIATKPKSESFNSFYNKFHIDSTFQMTRINFPIDGYNLEQNGKKDEWNKQNWLMHRSKFSEVDTAIFKVAKIVSTNKVEESLHIEGSGFNTKRIFKKINNKWYLVYFLNEEL